MYTYFSKHISLTVLVDLLDDLFEGGGGDLDAHHAQDVADSLRRDVALLVAVEAVEGAPQDDDLLLLQTGLLLRRDIGQSDTVRSSHTLSHMSVTHCHTCQSHTVTHVSHTLSHTVRHTLSHMSVTHCRTCQSHTVTYCQTQSYTVRYVQSQSWAQAMYVCYMYVCTIM